MKKLSVYILLTAFLFLSEPFSIAYAKETDDIVVTKNEKLYGLRDNTKIIFPEHFKKIRKTDYNGNRVFIGDGAYYTAFYSPDGLYDGFLQSYYENFSDISFKNYPQNGVIVFSNRVSELNKSLYGVMTVKDGIIYVTDQVFRRVEVPDENSIIFKNMKISFAPLNKIFVYENSGESFFNTLDDYLKNGFEAYVYRGEGINEKAVIREKIETADSQTVSAYEGFDFNSNPHIEVITPENMIFGAKPLRITFAREFKQGYKQFSSVEDFYSFLENRYNLKLTNYPENFVFYNDKTAEIIADNAFYEQMYVNYVSMCGDSILSKITGYNIAFQNPDEIIAKKDGAFGIVDKKGGLKIPFEYDTISPLYCNINETVRYNDETKRLELDFKGTDTKEGLYLAGKKTLQQEGGGFKTKYVLINNNNNILAEFDNSEINENGELKMIRLKSDEKANRDKRAQSRREFRENLPYNIAYAAMSIALLPVIFIWPDVLGIHENIRYFPNFRVKPHN